MSDGIRERARDALRVEIADTMCTVFAQRGFAEVTVEEAARAAGISRATFFRYFESKEDAVLVAVQATSLDYASTIADIDPLPEESVWRYVHRAFRSLIETIDEHDPNMRARVRMLNETPSIRARFAVHRFTQEDALATALAERGIERELARTVATAGLATANLAWRCWSIGEAASLLDAVDARFAELKAACTPGPAR